jgi:hypothetical protein
MKYILIALLLKVPIFHTLVLYQARYYLKIYQHVPSLSIIALSFCNIILARSCVCMELSPGKHIIKY